ncbi:NADP-dependent oxidoreductase [Micromonospora sp. C95]|uniref:NADP-dependent oxidoreductase n=1 Tax=Micromonospora sp. C95 TaxID=2824882 RepID=UPI001B35CA59|nr:NADP-dependent oxidoreductase [Micromonospora sp. C95]MBQ1025350.1 NADP-dependent oxidoreductase [Micromonospora sp. C95]
MHAIRMHEYGGPEVLRYEEAPIPVPGPGEVLIRVAGTSFNPADAIIRAGVLHHSHPVRMPHIPGTDVAGTIVELGADVTGRAIGDQVIAALPRPADGATGEFTLAPAATVVPAPTSIPLADAAALPVAGLTAWQGIHDHLRVRPGRRILVNGAGGGVGRLAVQFAKLAGATVVGVAGPASITAAQSAGADQILDYTVDRLTEPVDAVFNTAPIDGSGLNRLVTLIEPEGQLVSITSSASTDRHHAVRAMVMTVRWDPAQLDAIARGVDANQISPGVSERLPMTEIVEVHRRHAAARLSGKVVLIH